MVSTRHMAEASVEQQEDNLSSPSALDASPPKEELKRASPQVSPGDNTAEVGSDDDVGFGPPPAFPSSKSQLGKRKRTIMAVSSTTTGSAPLDESSSEDGSNSGKINNNNSQSIHRNVKAEDAAAIATAIRPPQKSPVEDALLLASLSDIGSPKKKELEFADHGKEEHGSKIEAPSSSDEQKNPDDNVEAVKPFALLPKVGGQSLGISNKRGKLNEDPNSPDGRDPKAVESPKNEKGPMEGGAFAPHYPGGGSYHPGPGYPYHHPHGPPPPPPPPHSRYPYHPYYAPYGPPGAPYPPRPYYPPGHPANQASSPPHHPTAAAAVAATPSSSSPSSAITSSPEKWGPYHSPNHQEHKSSSGATTGSSPPEAVRSNVETTTEATPPLFHPLAGSSSKISEDGEAAGAGARAGASTFAHQPPPPPPGYGPPPPGYPYGPPSEGYYTPHGPPVISPARPGSSSQHAAHHHPPSSGEYSPAVGTPPRGSGSGSYDYYEQGPPSGPPSASHSYRPPPPPGSYHPDSPPRSASGPYGPPPPHHPHYGPPPPSGEHPYYHDEYGTSPPPEAHYHVPASVSNETDPPPHHYAGGPPSPPSSSSHIHNSNKYHQFRKGGRSIHSEPIILRKKFSWRNYPELEEYLVANRSDYLRHSALNYTAEQKHFNNRLTEGLLELAAKLNYIFDETCFNFVAVRDRIRCYYKSYVQSSKKRGVVVGFSKQDDGGVMTKS